VKFSEQEPRCYTRALLGKIVLVLRLAVTLTFAACTLGAGSPPQVEKPESAGMSSERLARIGTWLDGVVERGEAAGFVTIVARRGKVVHHEARGTRGLSVKEPMPIDGIFDMASMTKAITVTAALILLEEGRFTLEDPLGDYLPGFKDARVQVGAKAFVPAESEITIRQLFTHTSGIADPRGRGEVYEFPTLKEYIQDAAKLPLQAQPGSTWLYGDSHDVLGYLVETVSGEPFGEFVRTRILDPLQMDDTHFWPPGSKDGRRAVLGVRGKDDLDSTSRRPLKAAEAATFIGGQSGIYSTAADYWRFCQMLLNGGELDGVRLLGPRTVGWINEDHMQGAGGFDRPGHVFGLGFAVMTDPGEAGWYYSPGSYYWSGSQGTLFWIDPQEELTAVLMVQTTPSSHLKLREKFAAIVYGAIVD